jgi:lysophospholipase L1-like esterase
MHRRTALLFAAAAVGCAAVAASLPGGAAAKAAPPRYYLSLGDSLSQGMQPDVNGVTRDTSQGYANDLLAIERNRIPSLKLVQLGCGGDTTTSLLTGHGNNTNARELHCDRAGGSQEAAAERFLRAHHRPGEVPLVTVDIGANDVDGCGAVPASQLVGCVTSGLGSIEHNLPKIFAGLKKAAPKGTTFAAMTLYDPFLSEYFAPAGSTGRSLEAESIVLAKVLNTDLITVDTRAHVLTADVAGAFDTYDGTNTVSWDGQQIPLDVARLCSWTWACQTPPSGPNIHANKNGYQVIAGAFAKVIGDRLH